LQYYISTYDAAISLSNNALCLIRGNTSWLCSYNAAKQNAQEDGRKWSYCPV